MLLGAIAGCHRRVSLVCHGEGRVTAIGGAMVGGMAPALGEWAWCHCTVRL